MLFGIEALKCRLDTRATAEENEWGTQGMFQALAMAAIFLASVMPPHQVASGWAISIAWCRIRSRKP